MLRDKKALGMVSILEKQENIKYVSIIVPTYNRDCCLLAAINSILNQTYQYFEIIVVDDGSTDDTEPLIRRVHDARITYIKLEENLGPSHARNVGIKHSRYEFIAFEDSDDIWCENKLEKQIKKLESNPDAAMIYCAYEYSIEGKAIKIPSDSYKKEQLEGYIFESLWDGNKIGAPTILVKKECIENVGGFSEELKSLEDYEFVLRVAKEYAIGYVNEILVKASYSASGVSSRFADQIDTQIHILKKYRACEVRVVDKMKQIMEMIVQMKGSTQERWKRKLVPDLISTELEFDLLYEMTKSNRAYRLVNKLINQFMDSDKIIHCLEKRIDFKHERFAIYGAGMVGRMLGELLRSRGLSFEYYIDREKTGTEETPIIRPDKVESSVKKVIVTVMDAVHDDFELNISGNPELVNIFDVCLR